MKFRNSLVAFLVLCLLIGSLYYLKKNRETEEKTEEKTKSVFSAKADSITGINLVNENGEFIINRLNPAQSDSAKEKMWKITKPVDCDGDGTFISGIATAIEELSKERTIEAKPDDLKNYGLDKPIFKLEIAYTDDDGKGKTASASFGEKNPGGSLQYISTDGKDRVFLAQTTLDYLKDKNLEAFRNKKIFDFKKDDVEKISAVYPSLNKNFLLDKSGKDFVISTPLKTAADKSGINTFINNIVNMRAEAFPSENFRESPAKWGLKSPYAEITLYLKDKTEAKLFLGKETKENNRLYLRTDAANVLEVRGGLKKDLTLDLKNIVDKTLFPWEKGEISKILLKQGKISHEIDYVNGKWFLTNYGDFADQEAANRIFSKFQTYKAQEFIASKADKSSGFGKPESLFAAFIDNKNQMAGRMMFGKKEGSKIFVLGGASNFVYLAGSSPHDKIIEDMKDIRNKKLFLHEKDKINYLEIAIDSSRVIFTKAHQGEEVIWNAKTEGKAIYDTGKKDIANDIAMITAFLTENRVIDRIDSFDPKKDFKTYGFDKPVVKISIGETGSETEMIVLGKKNTDDEHYYISKENVRPLYKVKASEPDMLLKLFGPLETDANTKK